VPHAFRALMRRQLRVPGFIEEILEDPRQRGILIAGTLALFTVGLLPRVLAPGLPSAQEQLRVEPEVQDLYLLLTFLSTGTVILGGFVSDLFRRRELMVGGLATIIGACLLSIVIDDGPVFYAANIVAVIAAGVVLAFGIGSVAIAYEGIPRATALGVVYGAQGAGNALSPILLTLIVVRIPSGEPGAPDGFAFETWLVYLLTAIAGALALWAALRWMPALPGKLTARRPLLIAIAGWTISVLALASGLIGLLAEGVEVVPVLLTALGTMGLAIGVLRRRDARRALEGAHFDRRGLTAALSVGVVVGFTQTIPLILLPAVFEYVLGYGFILSLVAIAPFAIALFLAGPVAGLLLRRFRPRAVLAGGTAMVGIANLVLGTLYLFFDENPGYLVFIVPLVFIGAGFLFSTAVRTAIVFASTPRRLPASAAALNESSVGLGSWIGVTLATSAVAAQAVDVSRSLLAGLGDTERLVEEFRTALAGLGTPRFEELLQAALDGAAAAKEQAYAEAFAQGVELALFVSGIVAILGAIVGWVLLSKRDPIRTVFELHEERGQSSADADISAP
jgi:MFS family permease